MADPKCSLCQGVGRVGDAYCTCKMGHDLRIAEEGLRKKQRTDSAKTDQALRRVLHIRKGRHA